MIPFEMIDKYVVDNGLYFITVYPTEELEIVQVGDLAHADYEYKIQLPDDVCAFTAHKLVNEWHKQWGV